MLLSFLLPVFAQDDEIPNDLSQEQWEAIRDILAIDAIKMLAKMDTLSQKIDSLKQVNAMYENFDCERELYAVVGATKEQVSDFRRKFEDTEKKVNQKIGTPDDARKMYFDEITNSKIRCLPEFSDRYHAMKKKLEPWESERTFITQTTPPGTYTVVTGDFLSRISELKYGNASMWPLIWEANRNSIVNPEHFWESELKRISNPNLIYPGQILKIPSVSQKEK
jgi:nucleoid-associated protein YgaU